MMIKKGFTLPEVIITLCVLGVIAAVLVPTITKNRPDENKIMLKKAYSTVEQTISELINDDVNYPATELALNSNGVMTQRGFNYKTPHANIPANTEKFCYLFTQKLNTIGVAACDDDGLLGTFETSDGLRWWMKGDFPMTPTPDYGIIVDVNGDKGPNCEFYDADTCAASHPNDVDTFTIFVRYDGKLSVDDAAAAILADPTNNKKN